MTLRSADAGVATGPTGATGLAICFPVAALILMGRCDDGRRARKSLRAADGRGIIQPWLAKHWFGGLGSRVVVSSRTPEGVPHRCPVCGNEAAVEPSYPGGDSCCPSCGQLLWWFRDRLGGEGGAGPQPVRLSSSFVDDLGLDSLDLVELIMELEEAFDIEIPDDPAEPITTVAEAIRYIERHRKR